MKFSTQAAGAAVFVLSLLGGTSAFAQTAVSDATVAFLMPDQGSTRYEEHDHPGFVAEMKKLCASCKVLYQNADADIAKQQQQFNSAITQGAKVIVDNLGRDLGAVYLPWWWWPITAIIRLLPWPIFKRLNI